jgi:hypothetical protein
VLALAYRSGQYARVAEVVGWDRVSHFRSGLSSGRGLGDRRLEETPVVEPYNAAAMRERLSLGRAFVGVGFTGHLPRRESAIGVNVYDKRFPFPIDGPGWLCLAPDDYVVVIYRGGAIKSGIAHLLAGEILLLNFHFSKIGITFSRWAKAQVWTAAALPADPPMPIWP